MSYRPIDPVEARRKLEEDLQDLPGQHIVWFWVPNQYEWLWPYALQNMHLAFAVVADLSAYLGIRIYAYMGGFDNYPPYWQERTNTGSVRPIIRKMMEIIAPGSVMTHTEIKPQEDVHRDS